MNEIFERFYHCSTYENPLNKKGYKTLDIGYIAVKPGA